MTSANYFSHFACVHFQFSLHINWFVCNVRDNVMIVFLTTTTQEHLSTVFLIPHYYFGQNYKYNNTLLLI